CGQGLLRLGDAVLRGGIYLRSPEPGRFAARPPFRRLLRSRAHDVRPYAVACETAARPGAVHAGHHRSWRAEGRGEVNQLGSIAVWTAIAIGGAIALGKIALYRGESISATWFVIAAACCYLVAYRLYSAFISAKLLALDDTRATPAERLDDGRDFVPTNKW